jgi:hypothetical protein
MECPGCGKRLPQWREWSHHYASVMDDRRRGRSPWPYSTGPGVSDAELCPWDRDFLFAEHLRQNPHLMHW